MKPSKRAYLIGLFGLTFMASACLLTGKSTVSDFPPESFQESDLIGTWEDYSNLHSTEQVTLLADHTFSQTITFDTGERYENSGEWYLEQRESGCAYVHLEGMRYYYLTEETANNGNRDPDGSFVYFWEECEERMISMPDKVILLVTTNIGLPKDIMLLHLNVGAIATDKMLVLVDQTPAAPE